MVPTLDPEDHKIVAAMMGVSDYDLRRHIDQASELAPDGRFSFVWFDRRARTSGEGGITLWPPLPDSHRAQIIVRRTADV
jgi:hypothetical protein